MARDAPARQVHELALCESRQITEVFLALTEHSFESIALIAPDGTILYSAPSTARLLGYMTDELVSHNVFTYIHSDDLQTVTGLFSQLVRKAGSTATHQFRLRHKDGSWRWIEGTWTNRLESPNVRAMVLNYRDINDRKLFEETFGINVDLSYLLLEKALHITAILDTRGTIRYVSPAIERVLGYTPETLKDKSAFSLIHPQDAPAVIERFKYRVQHPGVGELIEYRCLHKNGTWRVLESLGVNRLDDPRIAGIVINTRDVTERAWTAERLHRSLDALVAIHDAGRSLGSGVAWDAIGLALLESARRVASIEAGVVFLKNARGQVRVWQTLGPKWLWGPAHRARLEGRPTTGSTGGIVCAHSAAAARRADGGFERVVPAAECTGSGDRRP